MIVEKRLSEAIPYFIISASGGFDIHNDYGSMLYRGEE